MTAGWKNPGARQTGCELIAALMRAGQTRKELMQNTGVTENALNEWLREMRASGIVYRVKDPRPRLGRGGHHPVMYLLQTRPFEQADQV